MDSKNSTKFADTSLSEKASLVAWITLLPFFLAYKIASKANSSRPWTRICTEGLSRFCTDHLQYNQIQLIQPNTQRIFKSWTKSASIESYIDDLPTGAKLLWLGPKRLDNVLLFAHGGGFLFALSEFCLAFIAHVRSQLEARGIHVGVAILAYKLYPTARYPDQLRDGCAALSLLLKSGVAPSRMYLAGESAGGNNVLQILSHILHPHPKVESLPSPADLRFAGVFLMSPWVCPSGAAVGSDDNDIISSDRLSQWGRLFLQDLSHEEDGYVEPLKAPEGWYHGLGSVAGRVLMTSGSCESMAPAHVLFRDLCVKEGAEMSFLLDKGGCHDGLIYDFSMWFLQILQKPQIGSLTPKVIDWFAVGLL